MSEVDAQQLANYITRIWTVSGFVWLQVILNELKDTFELTDLWTKGPIISSISQFSKYDGTVRTGMFVPIALEKAQHILTVLKTKNTEVSIAQQIFEELVKELEGKKIL